MTRRHYRETYGARPCTPYETFLLVNQAAEGRASACGPQAVTRHELRLPSQHGCKWLEWQIVRILATARIAWMAWRAMRWTGSA
jgi:hypothetical protein